MDDLPDAKRILSGFDIIFDVSESKCNIDLFSIMGLKIDGIPRKNAKPEYRQHFSIYDIQQQNIVDSELHKFATGLMRLDCDFIARVAKNYDRRIWNISWKQLFLSSWSKQFKYRTVFHSMMFIIFVAQQRLCSPAKSFLFRNRSHLLREVTNHSMVK